MSKEKDLEFVDLVHDLVASGSEVADALDKMLETNEPAYVLRRQTAESIKDILLANTYLLRRMFEENQTLMEFIDSIGGDRS